MLRRLRVLLAFVLVPVVLLGNPRAAVAATVKPGPWHQVGVTVPMPIIGDTYGGNGTCKFNVQHAGTHMNVGSGGYCIGQPDVTPGWTQPGEAGSTFTIRFNGQDLAQAGSCTASVSGQLGQHERNGTITVAGSIPATGANFGGSDQCDVTEVCIELDQSPLGCTSRSITYPQEVDTGSCVHGFPASITYAWVDKGPNPNNSSFTNWEYTATLSLSVSGVSTARWWISHFNAAGQQGQTTRELLTNTWVTHTTSKRATDPFPSPNRPYGYEIYATPDSWNVDNDQSRVRALATREPISASDTFGGVTQPGHCRWYIGQKLVDLPNTTVDTPHADHGQTYTPTPPPVEPAVEPPPAIDVPEDYNWLQAIWAVLRAIASVLAGLAEAIVSGIASALDALLDGLLAGLEALFVPERSFQSRVDELDGEFEERFPFNVASSLSSMGITAGGGLPVNGKTTASTSSGVGSGGCPDWKVLFEANAERGGYVFDPICESSFTSAIRGARPFILAGLLVAAFWPLVRGLFFASVPVIKPVPTDGK